MHYHSHTFQGAHMRLTATVIFAAALAYGCSKPQDIVFGPEPLKQIAEQGDQFKKLPEEERALLVPESVTRQQPDCGKLLM